MKDIRIIKREAFKGDHAEILLNTLDKIEQFKHKGELRITTSAVLSGNMPELKAFNIILQALKRNGEKLVIITND